jgi:hypothetical protein
LLDRATSFFIHQYVLTVEDIGSGSRRGNLEYLPNLMNREVSDGPMRTIIAAAGLAALSNAGNSAMWAVESYQMYGKAIRQLQDDLNDRNKAKTDHTLAAIMLMGTFEVC